VHLADFLKFRMQRRTGLADIDPDDELPLDEVGPWASEKHARLRRYVDIAHGVRRMFAAGASRTASYIDLFCGSGRAKVRDTGEIIDGSPLVAYRAAVASADPFTEIHLADVDRSRCEAAAARIAALGGTAKIYPGRADKLVGEVVQKLNPHGLHFAFLDPFNLGDLPFSVLAELAAVKRMDMLVHVSAQDLQRNLRRYIDSKTCTLDGFSPGWRQVVDKRQTDRSIRQAILQHWLGRIRSLDMAPSEGIELVTADRNQQLYWLVFISRHERAADFWDKIRNPSSQGRLFP
jgi:three-Cys-motif partner protein